MTFDIDNISCFTCSSKFNNKIEIYLVDGATPPNSISPKFAGNIYKITKSDVQKTLKDLDIYFENPYVCCFYYKNGEAVDTVRGADMNKSSRWSSLWGQ